MTTFDATIGGASANSYITVAKADELAPLLVSSVRSAAWLAISPDTSKEVFLMRAAKLLETYMDFDGTKVSSSQALAWPRDWVYGLDGSTAYASDVIPLPVAEAQTLLAINLSEDFDQAAASGSPIESFKLSSLAIKFDTDRAARGSMLLPAEVVEKLRGFGDYAGTSGLARAITLVRA